MKLNLYTTFFTKNLPSSHIQPIKWASPLILILFLGLFGCTRTIATNELPAMQIVFGHGGGFTGMVHEYALLQNGYIVKIQKDSATQHIVKKIGKKKAAAYYAEVDSMRLHTWLYDVPGNIYHYIILKREGKKDNKIVWEGSGNDPHAPKNIEEYFKRLSSELPNMNKNLKK